MRRRGVKWRIANILEKIDYEKHALENKSDLFYTENDDLSKFLMTLFAAASSKNFESIYWEPIDKEWIIVNYKTLTKSDNARVKFFKNICRLDFQKIEIDENAPKELISYFHPDFNFNYKLEIARLVNGRTKRPKYIKEIPTVDLTEVISSCMGGGIFRMEIVFCQ